MPFGIQRSCGGSETSIKVPATISARLHRAMAWMVPMWFCTRRLRGMLITARPTSSVSTRGEMLEKYGA
ncbi:MAG: hypothetical protein MUE46_20585 [Xanthomonadales bacterium]|nr:hypothetical protein [Xanthomonadales bacterium]